MNKTRLLALATALCAGVALPASAQPLSGPGPWDRIGTVEFSFRPDHEVAYGRFGGRVERLSFIARNSNVRCNNITATFGNGQTRELYRGMLPRGREVTVDIPGQARQVRRIDFDCRSMTPRVASVDINADIGQYRAEWRRSPDWDRTWSRMFNWGDQLAGGPVADRGFGYGGSYADPRGGYADPRGDRYVQGPLEPAGWIRLGTEVFNGPFEGRSSVIGFDGRGVNRIAIRPIGSDARCRYVDVTFGDGSNRRLPINVDESLDEGRMHEFALGGYADVTQIDLACQASGGRSVRVEVMGRVG